VEVLTIIGLVLAIDKLRNGTRKSTEIRAALLCKAFVQFPVSSIVRRSEDMTMKRINRRDFLRSAAIAGGAAIITACAPAGSQATEVVGEEQQANSTATSAPVESAEMQVTATPPSKSPVTLRVNAYTPSEWTERSAEHPTVTNAPRLLADKFKEVEPNIDIEWIQYQAPEGMSGDTGYNAWLTTIVSGGNEPDIVWPLHYIPIQQGLCLPLDSYLEQPNPYATRYAAWKDIFFKNLLISCKFGDGHIYNAPLQEPFPGIEVGMAYNQEWLDKLGLKAPSTWSEQIEVCQAFREAGNGLAPWPAEAKEGNIWPVALQQLISLLQDPEGAEMDISKDFFIGVEEALPAFQNGLIGPTTAKYKTAWREMKKLADTWIDGWSTADLDTLWRNGEIAARTTLASEFSSMKSDPLIAFERVFSPMPYVSQADVEGANDPIEFSAGDGTLPGDLVLQINGPDNAIMKVTEERGTTEAAVKWLQWLSVPDNMAYLANENETSVPTSPDAELGPLNTQLASFKLPSWKYQISWWGEGLYFDNTQFNEIRKIFVAWMTGQMDEETFFERQQEETAAGAERYAASVAG
jgi:hypothetical protein